MCFTPVNFSLFGSLLFYFNIQQVSHRGNLFYLSPCNISSLQVGLDTRRIDIGTSGDRRQGYIMLG